MVTITPTPTRNLSNYQLNYGQHRSRSAGYCFTINNPAEDAQLHLLALEFRYLVFGREVGESGTPHLQGYIHFANKRDFAAVKKMYPGWHVEKRLGTVDQAVDYCKKDGDFTELGDKPLNPKEKGERSKQTHRDIIAHAKAGDIAWIEHHHPKVYLQQLPRLESLSEGTAAILDGVLEHEWWVGRTGTGKSRLAWELYPTHYQKQLNKWWDGYKGEEVVVIEEWSPKNECTGSQLKIWCDRYPFTGEIKGGTLKKIRPRKIIVLSNYTIEQCFTSASDVNPLLRRFTQFTFPEDEEMARLNGQTFQMPDPAATEEQVVESTEVDEEAPIVTELSEADMQTLLDMADL